MELMKWCHPHWDVLRTTIMQKGMGHFIGKSGQAAALELATALGGENRDALGFDPLMRAWSMINGRGIEMGLTLVGCPLCQLDAHQRECTTPGCQAPSGAAVIEGCTDSLRAYMRGLGLIPAQEDEP